MINSSKELKRASGVKQIKTNKIKLENQAFDSDAAKESVLYLNKRYKTDFSEDYIVKKFKAVTDSVQFFNLNHLNQISFSNFDYQKAIGFISSDSSHIVYRDLTGQQKTRYNNLCLNPDLEESSKVYNISTTVDVMAPSVDLIITEGIFDIIGVYSHFYKDNDENKIFAASCGKSFLTVILKYIRMGFLNLNIIIYSDADVNISFYKSMKNRSPYLKNAKITVYYNDLYDPNTGFGKDYGCPIEEIKLKKFII